MKLIFAFVFTTLLLFNDISSQEISGNYIDIFPKNNLQKGSQNLSNDVLLDHEGVLWLATNTGLVRWDGQQKKVYNRNAPNGNFVDGTLFRKIFERDSTALVIQAQDKQSSLSLLYKNKPRAQSIPFLGGKNSDIDASLNFTFQAPDGAIYTAIGFEKELEIYALLKDQFVFQASLKFDFSLEKEYIQVALFKNEFWVGIDGKGIWRCKDDTKKMVYNFEGSDLNPVRTLNILHADKNNRLWLLLNNEQNILQWNESKTQFLTISKQINYQVDVLDEDKYGNLLFTSGRYPHAITSLNLLKDKSWIDYSGLINSKVVSIHPTSDFTQSIIGVTFNNIQVVEVKTNRVQHMLEMELPPEKVYGNIIKGINEDLEGNIYFLEEIDGFYKMDVDTKEIIPIPLYDEAGKPLTFRCGGAIHRDNLGNIWFKTCDSNPEGRLVKYNPRTEEVDYFFLDQLIRDIDIDKKGNVWVTAHSIRDKKGSLFQLNIQSNEFNLVALNGIDQNNYFPEPRFLLHENDSTIWIGTIRGLVQADPLSYTYKIFTKENSELLNDRIIAIHQNLNGQLILGTYGGGVQLFDPSSGRVRRYTENDGLVDNYVCGIVPIDQHRYWLSTFNGLSYWDTEIELFTNFNKSHGFKYPEFNRYAFHAASDSTIYLGTVNGVNKFKTEDLIGLGQAPRIGISQFSKYYGKEDTLVVQNFDEGENPTIFLDPDVTYLELDLYAYDYKGGKTSKILTYLEGYDADWELVGKNGIVRYRKLPPGNYQLKVKGYSTQGVPSSNNLSIEINNKPYFYNTWYFLLASILTIGIFSYWFTKRRIRQVKSEESEKQKIQQRFATLELQALQAQLNPHFIFNALGAIQYYIQTNDIESADVYLTRFAQLMRKYLDGSKEKLISLKSEIELLKIYAELEQLRFDKIFKVELIVDPNLELEEIQLPSMMIQPFLENAVNHGLSPRKDGSGRLEVHFYKKNDSLVCQIRDNGIGRENAKSFKRKGHKSRGMSILDEKIQTMKMSNMMDIDIQIGDWNAANNQYPGTLVEITFAHLLEA